MKLHAAILVAVCVGVVPARGQYAVSAAATNVPEGQYCYVSGITTWALVLHPPGEGLPSGAMFRVKMPVVDLHAISCFSSETYCTVAAQAAVAALKDVGRDDVPVTCEQQSGTPTNPR